MQGGPGTDTVTYDYFFSQGTDDLQISLDNVANDGPITDPRGNIHSDVENLTTGNGDDTLDGGAGEDRINGNNSNNGNDTVRGGADDDVSTGATRWATTTWLAARASTSWPSSATATSR